MTLTALLEHLDGVAAQGPVLIVFEDAHWIDPTSQDLLNRMVARVTNLPVPLVVEELTRTLLEGGLLREASDSYVLEPMLSPLAVPTTLQDSLVARLDRLGPGKDVAMIGAAIGREFSHELIAAVSALPPVGLDAA